MYRSALSPYIRYLAKVGFYMNVYLEIYQIHCVLLVRFMSHQYTSMATFGSSTWTDLTKISGKLALGAKSYAVHCYIPRGYFVIII